MSEEKSRRELLEERKAAREAEQKAARQEQELVDDESIEEIESRTDVPTALVKLPFRKGFPTKILVGTPKKEHWKQFEAAVEAKRTEGEAEKFAARTVLYPDRETLARIFEAFPAVADNVAIVGMNLARGKAVEEGK